MSLSIEVREAGLMSNTSRGEEAEMMDSVKVKEIVIVTLILIIWFYSLYRSITMPSFNLNSLNFLQIFQSLERYPQLFCRNIAKVQRVYR